MGYFSIADLQLTAIAAAVPSQQVRNEDLSVFTGAEAKSFVKVVGIQSRRVAPPGMCASDLCVAAAEHVLQASGCDTAEIGAIVFVTETPDYLLPGNSTLIQRRLGLSPSTVMLDVNQGCAGYVYGLATLACLMSAAKIPKGLLLAGDTITRLLSPHDRSTVAIFSDAGSATLLELGACPDPMHFNLGGAGAGAEVIYVPAGGARQPLVPESLSLIEYEHGVRRAPIHLAMHGMDVLHYVLQFVTPNILELLKLAQANLNAPDYYVLHQANRILNESLVKTLGIVPDKVPESLSQYGNTSSATIPVTICRRLAGEVQSAKRTLLLSGFGAGFSWGSALIATDSLACADILELDQPAG